MIIYTKDKCIWVSGKKREGKRHFWRPRRRRHIKMGIKETGWEGMN
jgi:hypothetical protein